MDERMAETAQATDPYPYTGTTTNVGPLGAGGTAVPAPPTELELAHLRIDKLAARHASLLARLSAHLGIPLED